MYVVYSWMTGVEYGRYPTLEKANEIMGLLRRQFDHMQQWTWRFEP